ncbi:hypothetical protein BDN72DRAFT_751753, partial [Pluteus cervinus]
LIHQALDFILEPAKQAARIGYMMDDAFGRSRYCYTGLAGYISDLPEAQLVACAGGMSSPMSRANYLDLGDPYPHPPRTREFTLEEIRKVNRTGHDPWELDAYIAKSKAHKLNGIHKPFWRNWSTPILADPANFLNPDPLHHWHNGFYSHDLKWCTFALRKDEIDFRYMVLHPHTGFHHFSSGVSRLKQCTMRTHRDMQRYIVAVIAGAVDSDFLIAIRALCDVRYRAHALVLDDEDLGAIEDSLDEFHRHRHGITDAEARRGKRSAIGHWRIPKLETLQNIPRCVRSSGVCIQFSTERTEHEHIPTVKRPSRKTNNQNYPEQMCRQLDRVDK